MNRPGAAGHGPQQRGADWVYTPPQRGSAAALYAVCASHDGRYLAAGGGDKKVHIWDLRTGEHIQVRPYLAAQHSSCQCRTARRPLRVAQLAWNSVKTFKCEQCMPPMPSRGRGCNRSAHPAQKRQGGSQAFGGHKDLVSGVAFRQDSSQLFSASFDRSIKLWSVDDRAYMDSLFGHQSEVTAVDVLRQERCVTAGFDRTCRVWKVPEEAQLIFRASGLATDCVRCRLALSACLITSQSGHNYTACFVCQS